MICNVYYVYLLCTWQSSLDFLMKYVILSTDVLLLVYYFVSCKPFAIYNINVNMIASMYVL